MRKIGYYTAKTGDTYVKIINGTMNESPNKEDLDGLSRIVSGKLIGINAIDFKEILKQDKK